MGRRTGSDGAADRGHTEHRPGRARARGRLDVLGGVHLLLHSAGGVVYLGHGYHYEGVQNVHLQTGGEGGDKAGSSSVTCLGAGA